MAIFRGSPVCLSNWPCMDMEEPGRALPPRVLPSLGCPPSVPALSVHPPSLAPGSSHFGCSSVSVCSALPSQESYRVPCVVSLKELWSAAAHDAYGLVMLDCMLGSLSVNLCQGLLEIELGWLSLASALVTNWNHPVSKAEWFAIYQGGKVKDFTALKSSELNCMECFSQGGLFISGFSHNQGC